MVDRLPVLIAVRAAGCSPLEKAIEQDSATSVVIDDEPTVAEGIAITAPPRGKQILAAVRATRGTIVSVDDQQILAARAELAAHGLFVGAGNLEIGPPMAPSIVALAQRTFAVTVESACAKDSLDMDDQDRETIRRKVQACQARYVLSGYERSHLSRRRRHQGPGRRSIPVTPSRQLSSPPPARQNRPPPVNHRAHQRPAERRREGGQISIR